jgi:hypothetical protein
MVAPLKPTDIGRALQRGTQAELDEYQRLISERFESDPSLATAENAARERARLDRLRQLGRKLFGYG